MGRGADLLRRLQAEAADEDRQAPQEGLVAGREQVVAPLHRPLEGLVPGLTGAGPTGEEAEAVVEAGRDLLHAEGGGARRGQLDGEGDAVEAAADLGQGGGIGGSDGLVGVEGGAPVDEQPGRLVLQQRLDGGRRPRLGSGQRRDPPHHLARDVEGLAAGGQHPQQGTGPQEGVDQGGSGLQDVLTVVDDQDRLPGAEVVDQGVDDGQGLRLHHAHRGRDGPRHERPVSQGDQVDEPGAVGVGGE